MLSLNREPIIISGFSFEFLHRRIACVRSEMRATFCQNGDRRWKILIRNDTNPVSQRLQKRVNAAIVSCENSICVRTFARRTVVIERMERIQRQLPIFWRFAVSEARRRCTDKMTKTRTVEKIKTDTAIFQVTNPKTKGALRKMLISRQWRQ